MTAHREPIGPAGVPDAAAAPARAMRADLTGLLATCDAATFLADWAGRRAGLFGRASPATPPPIARADLLAGLRCLDWLDSGRAKLSRAPHVAPRTFAKAARANIEGFLDQKWSVVVDWVERDLVPIRAVCDALARTVAAPVVANAYYTPGDARCFDWHRDGQDVLVWQLSGVKHWKVADFDAAAPYDAPVIETELRAGQILYIPEGMPHVAETTAGHDSLHVSLSFQAAGRHLIKSLPQDLHDWLTGWDALSPLSGPEVRRTGALAALDAFRATLAARPVPDAETGPVEVSLPALGPATRLVLADGVRLLPAAPEASEESVHFGVDGAPLAFAPHLRPALERLSSEPTAPGDLPLPPEDAMDLARILTLTGLARTS